MTLQFVLFAFVSFFISSSLEGDIKAIDNLIDKSITFNQAQKELSKFYADLHEVEDTIRTSKSISALEKEKKDLENDIKSVESDAKKKEKLQEKIESLEKEKKDIVQLTEALRSYESTQNELTRINLDMKDLYEALGRYKSIVQILETEKKELEQAKEKAGKEIAPLNSVMKKLAFLQSTLMRLENELRSNRDKITTTRTSLEYYTKTKKELEADMKFKEKKLEAINLLSE